MNCLNTVQLTAKVAAKNAANDALLRWAGAVREVICAFLNQKIRLASGGFSSKFQKALETLDLPCSHREHVWVSAGQGYSLIMNVRVSVIDSNGGTQYGEAVCYVADLRNGVVAKMYPPVDHTDYPTNYNVAAVETLREELTAAQGRVSNLTGQLSQILN